MCDARRGRWPRWPTNWASRWSATDVDAPRPPVTTALRAEFGDRLPVVLLDGAEHSYWEVDEQRLRADLRPGEMHGEPYGNLVPGW